jgi:hypothetical protein
LAFTAGLKKWDGAAFIDPGVAQIQAFTGSFSAPTGTATTEDAPTQSLQIPAGAATVDFAADGVETHATARYRYLGDGVNPSSAPVGIYLLSLQLFNPASGTQSDPFYYVLNKAGSPSALAEAIGSLDVSPGLVQLLVPEPASAGLCALGLGAVRKIAQRRRGRRS